MTPQATDKQLRIRPETIWNVRCYSQMIQFSVDQLVDQPFTLQDFLIATGWYYFNNKID